MASVQSTRKRRYESLAFGEEPTPHIESEGDRLIKDLSRKQLDTTLSLEKQKQAEKQFTRGSGFVVPLSVCQAGPSSAGDIASKTVWAQRFNQLRHHGLTVEEASAILNGDDVTSLNSKCEATARLKRAEEIRQIVERINTQEETDDSESISRHEKELALAVKPTSDQTRLFAFALSCQQSKDQGLLKDDRPLQGLLKDDRPLEHPINQLAELHDQLFNDVSNPRQAAKTVLRKRRQIIDSMKPAQQVPFEPVSEPHSKKTNWDNQTVAENKPQTKPIREYTCKRETFYTIKDGKIVELKGKPKKEEVKVEGEQKRMVIGGEPFVVPQGGEKKTEGEGKEEFERMSVEDIRNIPRFKDYERGQPSKVLYLKNLSRTIDEQDLVKLFSKYQNDKEAHIVYRLMTGRMSGHAFVTFSSIEQATLALDEVFGVVLKGKPIVIQFGRNT